MIIDQNSTPSDSQARLAVIEQQQAQTKVNF